MKKLSQSELKLFRDCRRAWWLKHVRRLQLKPEYVKPGAAYLGSTVHALLEADDLGADWREAHTELLRASEEVLEGYPEKQEAVRATFEHAEIIVDGYFDWLETSGADQFLESVATEEMIEVPFDGMTDVSLIGKLDKRVRDLNSDQTVFVDYKTTGNLTDIPRDAHINEQFHHYSLVLSEKYPDLPLPTKGIWRMLTKSKRTDRTIKEDGSVTDFYGEHSVELNSHQLESYKIKVKGILADMEEVESKLAAGADHREVVYSRPNMECHWKCPYFGICGMFDDGSRVEEFISDWYEEGDPLDRYQKESE